MTSEGGWLRVSLVGQSVKALGKQHGPRALAAVQPRQRACSGGPRAETSFGNPVDSTSDRA